MAVERESKGYWEAGKKEEKKKGRKRKLGRFVLFFVAGEKLAHIIQAFLLLKESRLHHRNHIN